MPLPRPEESISITSERPTEDILNFDLGGASPSTQHHTDDIHNETYEGKETSLISLEIIP